MHVLAAMLVLAALAAADAPTPTPIPAPATPLPANVGAPAGTTIHFHTMTTLSSKTSKSGSSFIFAMSSPIMRNGKTLVATGATGNGTLVLAGPAGIKGHEGDLTLRLENVWTVKKHVLNLNQTIAIDGRNIKAYTAALGFVPFVGAAGMLLHGQDITISPSQTITTVLKQDAIITHVGD